ncbi:uncharacterized protein [Rutidosis leptorrhynchoides]|uniref:uncharacterized protein isoform X2 n=1 Tax=Rutidosis leptorrhynchoides TaxID=125765 RepID=UPI003A999707
MQLLLMVLALCCNCLFTMLKSDDLYLILISSSIPKITPLADLRPYDNGKVIEVKVYCIWIARNPPDQTPLGYCVILLDEMGNTISGKCFRYKILQLGSRHRQSLYCK